MRIVQGDVNVYYYHNELTPNNVRMATYGNGQRSVVLVPEVGDILRDFPGRDGREYVPITVRVTGVTQIGAGVEAYEVRTTTA